MGRLDKRHFNCRSYEHTIRLPIAVPKDAAAAFLMQAKSKKARVFAISAPVKDPQVVKINPEPCTTARLIVCVESAHY